MLTGRPEVTFLAALSLVAISAPAAQLDSARDVTQMAEAASAFLASLPADRRDEAAFDFASDERLRFHFIPPESYPRSGLRLRDMTADQRDRAEALLRAGLSARGLLTTQQIIQLEGILRDIEGGGRRLARDPDEYFVSVFGPPSSSGTWGWRFEGHHLSLHFTIVEGSGVASSPAFLGANPAEVREGPNRGLRPLAREEDAARALVTALDDGQRASAVIDDIVPRDIVTGAELEIAPLSPVGIRADQLDERQRALLMELIDAYVSHMADDVALQRVERLRAAGMDAVTFAWAGSVERGAPHYYRVQGPTFLIEYDNTQNDANHIHSVWRDFDGDFGQDLLREHMREAHAGGQQGHRHPHR
jgi:hypothetical protein